MNTHQRLIFGSLLALCGLALFFIRSDRQFINLLPTRGLPHAITLESGHVYAQEFVIHTSPVSQIGIYLRSFGDTPPDLPVTVRVLHERRLIHEQKLPAVFADPEATSEIRLPAPLSVTPLEILRVEVTVPPELSGRMALQTRALDGTFNNDASFFIDEHRQTNPLAYQVYAAVRPALTLHVASLLILAAVWVLGGLQLATSRGLIVYAAALAIIANVPAMLMGIFAAQLLIIQTIVLLGALAYGRRLNISQPASLLTAHTLAFTTWWPLVMLFARPGATATTPFVSSITQVLFDPNQITPETAGAYVGLFAAAFAVIGVAFWSDRSLNYLRIIGVCFTLAGFIVSPLLVAIGIAILAAIGLQNLSNFLDTNSRTVRLLLYIVVYIALVDTLAVYARLWSTL